MSKRSTKRSEGNMKNKKYRQMLARLQKRPGEEVRHVSQEEWRRGRRRESQLRVVPGPRHAIPPPPSHYPPDGNEAFGFYVLVYIDSPIWQLARMRSTGNARLDVINLTFAEDERGWFHLREKAKSLALRSYGSSSRDTVLEIALGNAEDLVATVPGLESIPYTKEKIRRAVFLYEDIIFP